MSEKDDDYRVGHKKPPREHQWPKGTSGNIHGKPRGTKSVSATFRKAALEKVEVRVRGRVRKMSKLDLLVGRTIEDAAKGDRKATELSLRYLAQALPEELLTPKDVEPQAEDLAVLENYLSLREVTEVLRAEQARAAEIRAARAERDARKKKR